MTNKENHKYPITDRIIGHRGASGYAPENTEASIRKAAELGCKWIEVDITISRDGVPLLFHDSELDRCTNGHGLIALQDWYDLSQLDAGSWFGVEFQGERILPLQRLIVLADELSLGVNLEIKPTIGRELQTLEAVKHTLKRYTQMHTQLPPLLLSSFNVIALQHARALLPSIPRALNVEAIPRDWEAQLESVGACALHFAREFADADVIKHISTRYAVSCFTVNAQEPALWLWEHGVVSVFTDLPDCIS